MKFKNLFISILLILLIAIPAQSIELTTCTVSCSPNIVGSSGATLTIQSSIQTSIPINGQIRITVPSGTSLLPSPQCVININSNPSITLPCTISGQKLVITVNQLISGGSTTLITRLVGGFVAPSSHAETQSFLFQTYSSSIATIPLDEQITQLTLIVNPASLVTAQITQETQSSKEVGIISSILVSVKTTNQIPVGGLIQMVFPVWNSDANPSQQVSLINNPTNMICLNILGLSSGLSCTFDSTQNILTISNAFTSILPSGSQFQFSISNVLNPISLQPVFITIQTLIPVGGTGIIDQSQTTFAAQTQTSIVTASVSSDSYIVQEYSNIQVRFYNPVPLNIGCTVTVYFPWQFTEDSQLVSVSGYGIFGSYRQLQFQLNQGQGSVQILNGCQSYRPANIEGVLTFTTIKNPYYAMKTESIEIYLQNSQGYAIAYIQSGLQFTPQPGTITNLVATPQNNIVNSQTSILLQFTVPHILITQQSFITVQFPTNLAISCNTQCSQFTIGYSCQNQGGQKILLSNIFGSTGFIGGQISLTINSIILPQSVQSLLNFNVSTYETYKSFPYLVDTLLLTTSLFQVQSGEFLSSQVLVSTQQTFTPATFTFKFQIMNTIPSTGILILVLPTDITIKSSTLLCLSITNLLSTMTCTQQTSNGITTITILGAISSSQQLVQDDFISFSVSSLITPLTVSTSGSFTFSSQDQYSQTIDIISQYLTVTMTQGITISNIQVGSNSLVVGAIATHTIQFITPTKISTSNKLQITIPLEVTSPSKGVTCSSLSPLSQQQSCQVSGRIVSISAQVINPSQSTLGQTIIINIAGLINPSSTKPTSSYSILISDSRGYLMAQTTLQTNAILKMTIPAQITSSQFYASNLQPLAVSSFVVSIITLHQIPKSGYISISINTQEIQPYPFPPTSTLSCTSNIQQNPLCQYVPSQQIIQISNIFNQDYSPGLNLTITLTSMKILLTKQSQSQSWNLTTFTSDNYMIDRSDQNLYISLTCNTPCLTCSSTNPNFCLTCNPNSAQTILYNGYCYSYCPSGTFYNISGQTCDPCSSNCYTCSNNDPNMCTSCKPQSSLPYLNGNTCSDQCAFGFYGDYSLKKCIACTSPCASCSGPLSNQCQSCNPVSVNKYFYQSQCISTCPSGWLSPSGSTDFVCNQCDPNCKECLGDSSTCTKCNNPQILSMYDNTCVTSCPQGITVYSSSQNVCQVCDVTCNTCSTSNTSWCSSCSNNLYLLQGSGSCIGDCSKTTLGNKLVGQNGVCVQCTSNCLTCQHSPNECLTCSSNTLFYNYTCLATCPNGYESNSEKHCVLKGLQCPFGYEPNALGTACMLNAQICLEGYILNLDKTRCIPVPGKYIPFPMLITSFALFIVTLVSKYLYRETVISSTIISYLSLIEFIGMLAQISQSHLIGLRSTMALTILAFLFNFGCNIFFAVIYFKQVRNTDSAFKYWAINFSKTEKIISLIGSMLSFKSFRILYCRLFGFDCFNAPLHDPDSYYKPYTFISIFSLVSTMLPLMVGNIIGIIFIQYGYQVFINCLEMTVIEVVILALSIYEYILIKKHMFSQSSYLKVQPKQQSSTQGGVFGAIMASDASMIEDSFGNDSKSFYQTQDKQRNGYAGRVAGVTYEEFNERKNLLEVLLNKLNGRVTQDKKKDYNPSSMELINAMQEEEIMRLQMRRCISFRELREEDQDFGDDQDYQNFISCPTSPREKEMLYNPFFSGKMADLKKIYRLRDQQDNVYAESKPLYQFPLKDCKLVSVQIQVSPLELLGLEDPMLKKSKAPFMSILDKIDEGYVEENVDNSYTNGLLGNIINGIQDDDKQLTKKKRRRLPKARLQQIPDFQLSDIMGTFQIDNQGNNIMIRNTDGKLIDSQGKRVNTMGYLLDVEGNVITNNGTKIFRKDEIDSDDEIPAPYCFEKKKESLFKIENSLEQPQKQKKKKTIIKGSDQDIENQYKQLKAKNKSNRSSVDSLTGETPSKYNSKNQRKFETANDKFLNKIVQPIQAKTISEFENQNHESIKSKSNKKLSKQQLIESQQKSDSKKQDSGNQQSNNNFNNGEDDNNNGQSNKQSTKDLFFSSLAKSQGVNRGRPFIGGLGPSSSQMSRQNNVNSKQVLPQHSQPLSQLKSKKPMDISNYHFLTSGDEGEKSTFSKIKQLRAALGHNNKDDEILLKKLQYLENNYVLQNANSRKTNLVNKHLQKVYGKVQDKFFQQTGMQFHEAKNQDSSKELQIGFEDNESMAYLKNGIFGSKGFENKLNDSRLKGLEQIYLNKLANKRAQSSMSKHRIPSGLAKFRPLQHSLAEGNQNISGIGGYVDSSDMDQIQIQAELDKMKTILDKSDQQQAENKKNLTNAKLKSQISNSQKHIIEGGWI